MSRRKVLVKRLVCIEDLGDVDTLFTDKTGTLTEGRISYLRVVPAGSAPEASLLRAALLCTETERLDGPAVGLAGANPLHTALWEAPVSVEQRARLAREVELALGLRPAVTVGAVRREERRDLLVEVRRRGRGQRRENEEERDRDETRHGAIVANREREYH